MPSSTKLPEPAPRKPGRPGDDKGAPARPAPRPGKQAAPARAADKPVPARPAAGNGAAAEAPADEKSSPLPLAAAGAAVPQRPQAAVAAGAPPAKSAAQAAPAEEYEDEYDDDSWLRQVTRNLPAWLISALFHMALVLMLAMLDMGLEEKDDNKVLSLFPSENQEELEELLEMPEIEDFDVDELDDSVDLSEPVEMVDAVDNLDVSNELLADPSETPDTEQMAKVEMNVSDILNVAGPQADVLSQLGSGVADGKGMVGGRSSEGRKQAVKARGGTPDSEAAVEAALAWLAAHQNPNGSWCFDHRGGGQCNGQCSEPDAQHAKHYDGATGLALLPFFGAGYNHLDGKYKDTVGRGLNFLLNHGKMDKNGFKLDGGYMYGHGIASIALCEAYGMSGDSTLRDAAQASVAYIVSQQSPKTGGFGYHGPGQDTSVLGWQMMAYKSANLAGLYVPPAAVAGIHHNLDHVVGMRGEYGISYYGYNAPQKRASTTAIGALSRMYMGWPRNPALEETVAYISRTGPDPKSMYFNYYATQVLFQYTDGEGDIWDKWNNKMRDFLIATQDKQGHQVGSWSKSKIAKHGGRLYATCMAAMTLEVYYRHMPIYQKRNIKGDKGKGEQDEFTFD